MKTKTKPETIEEYIAEIMEMLNNCVDPTVIYLIYDILALKK